MQIFFQVAVNILILCLCFTSVSASECWNSNEMSEIEGFAELDDTIILSFKDAVDCSAVSGADVLFSISGNGINIKSDSIGYIAIPSSVFEGIVDGQMSVTVKKEGYIPLKTEMDILSGSIWQKKFLLSRELPLDKLRLVLQWDNKPTDLDLHMIKDDSVHISYRNKQYIPDLAKLDRDDTDGFGPETITLDNTDENSTYRVFVHNFSNDKPFQGKGKVFVYAGNRLDRIVKLPVTASGEIDILEISNRKIKYFLE